MGFTSGQLATASLIGQIGGVASSTIGSYYSAKTQQANLRGQSVVAESNARLAELSAQSALLQGQKQVAALTMKAGQIKGSQRAAMAANGIDLGEGSAAELQASTEIMKDIDKNQLEANAVANAWGYRLQKTNYENEALSAKAGASTINPGMSAASTLLGGAGSVASSWYQFSKVGAIGSGTSSSSATSKTQVGSFDYSLGSSKLNNWY